MLNLRITFDADGSADDIAADIDGRPVDILPEAMALLGEIELHANRFGPLLCAPWFEIVPEDA